MFCRFQPRCRALFGFFLGKDLLTSAKRKRPAQGIVARATPHVGSNRLHTVYHPTPIAGVVDISDAADLATCAQQERTEHHIPHTYSVLYACHIPPPRRAVLNGSIISASLGSLPIEGCCLSPTRRVVNRSLLKEVMAPTSDSSPTECMSSASILL